MKIFKVTNRGLGVWNAVAVKNRVNVLRLKKFFFFYLILFYFIIIYILFILFLFYYRKKDFKITDGIQRVYGCNDRLLRRSWL